MGWLESFPYKLLIPLAIFMALAPFVPEPHLVEKVRMLFNGTLRKPLDIFDLLFHAAPLILLFVKFILENFAGGKN